MSRPIPQLTDEELPRTMADDEPGFGSLATPRGHLPLKAMDIQGRIDGLLSQVSVRQTFVNPLDEPLEATYIFPLPDRAAVRGFRMVIGGRTIEGLLQEREQARQDMNRRSRPAIMRPLPKRSGPTSSRSGSATSCPARKRRCTWSWPASCPTRAEKSRFVSRWSSRLGTSRGSRFQARR